MNIEIKDKLYKDIENYCTLNELDINQYINGLLKKSFMLDKYGERPPISNTVKSDEIIPIDRPMEAPDKTILEEIKNQETVVVVLKEKDEEKPVYGPIDSVKDEPINEPINEPTSEPIKEKPKRHKLTKK